MILDYLIERADSLRQNASTNDDIARLVRRLRKHCPALFDINVGISYASQYSLHLRVPDHATAIQVIAAIPGKWMKELNPPSYEGDNATTAYSLQGGFVNFWADEDCTSNNDIDVANPLPITVVFAGLPPTCTIHEETVAVPARMEKRFRGSCNEPRSNESETGTPVDA